MGVNPKNEVIKNNLKMKHKVSEEEWLQKMEGQFGKVQIIGFANNNFLDCHSLNNGYDNTMLFAVKDFHSQLNGNNERLGYGANGKAVFQEIAKIKQTDCLSGLE